MKIKVDQHLIELASVNKLEGSLSFTMDGEEFIYQYLKKEDKLYLLKDKEKWELSTLKTGKETQIFFGAREIFAAKESLRSSRAQDEDSSMTAPMPGKILKILKNVGDKVKLSDSILVMEAMKMEHTIKASVDGMIEAIYFKEGEQVESGAKLAQIEESDESSSSS